MMAIKNNRGQFAIEAVLLMIATVGIFMAGTNALRESKFLAKTISGPWEKVSGMLEAGVWEAPAAARKQHPNQIDRSRSLDPSQ